MSYGFCFLLGNVLSSSYIHLPSRTYMIIVFTFKFLRHLSLFCCRGLGKVKVFPSSYPIDSIPFISNTAYVIIQFPICIVFTSRLAVISLTVSFLVPNYANYCSFVMKHVRRYARTWCCSLLSFSSPRTLLAILNTYFLA